MNVQSMTRLIGDLERLAGLFSSLDAQSGDIAGLMQSERRRLHSLSDNFQQYADAIKKVVPNGDTFDVTWVFQKILGDSRMIHDTEMLERFSRWLTDGEPLLEFVDKVSYDELSALSNAGRH